MLMHSAVMDAQFYIQLAIRIMPDELTIESSTNVSHAFPGAVMTPFEMDMTGRSVLDILPMEDALLHIVIASEASIATHVFVLPLDDALVTGIVEHIYGDERFVGVFVSCTDPFSLDAIAEMYAVSQRSLAQAKVIDRVTRLLKPLLSPDTSAMLAQSLGASMTPQMATQFAEAFGENLNVAAKFGDITRRKKAHGDREKP